MNLESGSVEEFARFFSGLRDIRVLDVLDIVLVTYLFYRLSLLIRGSRAWRILGGVITFLVMLFVSDRLQLNALHWLLDKATLLAPVALVILLLPELRAALEGFGKLGFWPQSITSGDRRMEGSTVEEIVASVAEMSASSTGALIVIERAANLDDIIGNGVAIDARITAPLLCSIFYEGNPLHDGAVVIQGNKVASAASRLPLSESSRMDNTLHMRHRAAVGVTEGLDCLAVVVSEERGTIRVAMDGVLRKMATHSDLRDFLNEHARGVPPDAKSVSARRRTKGGAA